MPQLPQSNIAENLSATMTPLEQMLGNRRPDVGPEFPGIGEGQGGGLRQMAGAFAPGPRRAPSSSPIAPPAGGSGGASSGGLAGVLGGMSPAALQAFSTQWKTFDTAPMQDQLGFFANLMGGNDAYSKIIQAIAARGGGGAAGAQPTGPAPTIPGTI